ncbi:hypothetical protein PIB30_083715 [Stylosanthes scabra]|uniref:RNase H type-1 domain-containing protein n=1 Tax=Stylosanthes scabra TaxID=79078 RepID=A0ABU6URR6_9FABA|nr:hypothetical protein [Stylosanthes scabra]
MREALVAAKNLQIEKVLLESDCAILIQAIKSDSTIAEIDPILKDIQEISKSIPFRGFIWVPRDCNRVAVSGWGVKVLHAVRVGSSSAELGGKGRCVSLGWVRLARRG